MDEMSYCSFSGAEVYKNHFKPGVYVCSECGHELFSSMSKFEHSSPWPAFSETIREDSVSKQPEAWGPIKVAYLCKHRLDVCDMQFAVGSVEMDWAMSSCMTAQEKGYRASEYSVARWCSSLQKKLMDRQASIEREERFLLLTVDEVLWGKARWSSRAQMDSDLTGLQQQIC